MKKLIAIPLLVLYLVAVSGMMVQLHFCGSQLYSWNVNKSSPSCCCGDKKTPPADHKATLKSATDNCCSNKVITLKIAQDQYKANDIQPQLALLQLAQLPAHIVVFLPQVDIPSSPVTHTYNANAPPGIWQNIPLYKLHSRFTYYG